MNSVVCAIEGHLVGTDISCSLYYPPPTREISVDVIEYTCTRCGERLKFIAHDQYSTIEKLAQGVTHVTYNEVKHIIIRIEVLSCIQERRKDEF